MWAILFHINLLFYIFSVSIDNLSQTLERKSIIKSASNRNGIRMYVCKIVE
jgi:hypothetical protein